MTSHPGVCGENVFQCHKCRSINYDERDPFLCTSCGFCKYAKFGVSVVGRPATEHVDAIESEEDKHATMQTMHALLDRVDKLYHHMSQQTRPTFELLIVKMNEQNVLDRFASTAAATASAPPTTTSQALLNF